LGVVLRFLDFLRFACVFGLVPKSTVSKGWLNELLKFLLCDTKLPDLICSEGFRVLMLESIFLYGVAPPGTKLPLLWSTDPSRFFYLTAAGAGAEGAVIGFS
jgi:hypothetical protein